MCEPFAEKCSNRLEYFRIKVLFCNAIVILLIVCINILNLFVFLYTKAKKFYNYFSRLFFFSLLKHFVYILLLLFECKNESWYLRYLLARLDINKSVDWFVWNCLGFQMNLTVFHVSMYFILYEPWFSYVCVFFFH